MFKYILTALFSVALLGSALAEDIKVCPNLGMDYTYSLIEMERIGIEVETFTEADSEKIIAVLSSGHAKPEKYQWMVAATKSPDGEHVGIFIFTDGCYFKNVAVTQKFWTDTKLAAGLTNV